MISTTPWLELRDVSKTFPIEGGVFRHRIGSVQALKNVSFQVAKGETLALVGGSGSGKSTLAKLITGLLTPDSGTLLWEGQSLQFMERRQRARRIQMIFQDPFASLNPKLSIGSQLREVVELQDVIARSEATKQAPDSRGVASLPPVARNDTFTRCRELLEAVGLSGDAMSHYPFQFSGGQRQRVAIARALALKPALLIADEPLSALDVTIQANILELLRTLKQTYQLTVLFISHDLAVVHSFADRMIVMQNGMAVEEGPVAGVLAHPQHAYTRALIEALPRIEI
jgi:peptide/nickel transport system ATP-binding protein